MSRRIELQPHLSTAELYERYGACRWPHEKARWRALYLIPLIQEALCSPPQWGQHREGGG